MRRFVSPVRQARRWAAIEAQRRAEERAIKQMRQVAVGAALLGGLAPLPGTAETSRSQAALEEILVTAQRREVALQEAPVAVSVLPGADFDRSGIVRLDNFNGYLPGLVIAKNDGAGRIAAIRGIGWETAQNLATQPSVLTYIDGIYLANPLAMGLDLGELERVEVFRGPQGTEFGQGTTGGAVNLVTKKPQLGARTGAVELGYGAFRRLQARAALNLPIGERLAFRGSAQRYRRDGFAEIEGGELDGYQLDDADSVTGKLALLWQPAERFSVLAQAFALDSDQHAAAQKNVLDPNPNPRRLTQDYPGVFKLRNTSAALILTWEAAPSLHFKSLTGWQQLRKRQSVDGDRLTEALTRVDSIGFGQAKIWDVLPFWDNDSDAVSQEFSLNWDGDRFRWAAGYYYLNHANFNDFLEANGAGPFAQSPAARPRAELTAQTLPPFQSDLNFAEQRTVTRKDHALYAQGAYRVHDALSLTVGLRYQNEKQLDEGGLFFAARPPRTTKDGKITWKLGADLHYAENHLLYGLISTGWKNGGANGGGLLLPERFEPEELTAIELGARSRLLDGRVHFNAAIFRYDHRHLQFTYEDPAPFSGGTWTIPKLEEYGLEAEFSWRMGEDWQLDGMLAVQDGRVKSDVFALDVEDFRTALRSFQLGLFTPGAVQERIRMGRANNLRGNKPPKLPALLARLALTHAHRFADGARLNSRLEYVHRGAFQARVFNHPAVDPVPAYGIVNAHFSYDWADWPLGLSFILTNLLDRDGVNNVFTNPYGLWTTSEEFIPPRELLVSVRFRLNP